MNRESATLRLVPLSPEVLAELEALVRQQLGGRMRDFRVSIRDAGLVLRGRARSHHAKQLAQHVVMDFAQETIRANEIEVCGNPRRAPPVAAVTGAATLDSGLPRGLPPGDLTM